MAEITPVQRLGVSDDDKQMIMALRDQVHYDGADEVDQGLAADLVALRSRVAALLQQQLQDAAPPLSPESWRWVDAVERTARGAAEILAGQAADIHRALSLLSSPRVSGADAEASLAELLRQAAYTADRRADAEEVVSLARLIREEDMRRMAEAVAVAAEGLLHPDAAAFLAAAAGASEERMMLRRMAAAEHLVHPSTAAFLGYITSDADASLARGEAMPAGELARAPEVEDMAARTEESLAALARRLRRAAAELFAGEEAVAAALERHAADADAARAEVEEFTAFVRRFRAAAAGSALPPPAPATATGWYLRPRSRAAGGSALHPTGTGTSCSFRPKL